MKIVFFIIAIAFMTFESLLLYKNGMPWMLWPYCALCLLATVSGLFKMKIGPFSIEANLAALIVIGILLIGLIPPLRQ